MTSDSLTTWPRSDATPSAQATLLPFVVVLRRHLEEGDVARLLHYVSDFGTGNARAAAFAGGWSIRLDAMSDVRLLTFQCGDLIDDFIVQEGG